MLTGLTRVQGLEDIGKLSLVHQAVSLNLSVSDW